MVKFHHDLQRQKKLIDWNIYLEIILNNFRIIVLCIKIQIN